MGDPTKTHSGFDIAFPKLFPPELTVQLWVLALDADTSKVGLAYHHGPWTTSLNYSYGSSLSAKLAIRRASLSVGFNPSNDNVDLGLVYRGFRFNATAGLQKRTESLSLSYGAPLLPFPDDLAASFKAANAGFQKMVGDAGSAAANPLRYYQLHSNDVTAIGKAVKLGQTIYQSGKSQDPFGGNIRLNYSPTTGLTFYLTLGVRF